MLIGLHGKARSGKDSVFRMIQEDFGSPSTKVVRGAFADRLKLSACRCFKPDATLEEALEWSEQLKTDAELTVSLYDLREVWPVSELTVTGRQFLQYYGTEAHRSVFAPDFWVDALLPNWQDDDYGRQDGLTRNDILVITDVRFANEAERIIDCAGVVWEIARPGTEVGDPHASEQRLPDEYISYTIENLTSLDALRAKVNLGVYHLLSQEVGA